MWVPELGEGITGQKAEDNLVRNHLAKTCEGRTTARMANQHFTHYPIVGDVQPDGTSRELLCALDIRVATGRDDFVARSSTRRHGAALPPNHLIVRPYHVNVLSQSTRPRVGTTQGASLARHTMRGGWRSG
jgi:hypothetical protein